MKAQIRLIILFLTFATLKCSGITWTAAYPYTQQIDGQNIIVKAFPYDPYTGSPMIGVTRVYHKNKLLYSIDKYFREDIFTSNDGQYLVVLHTSNSAGIASYTSFGAERMNFNQTAIEVFKNGLPFKKFTLKEVVDTTKLVNNSRFFYWGYNIDYKAFKDAIWDCDYWQKNLTRGEKKECLNGDTTSYCKEWIDGCDSARIFAREKFIAENSAYVQNNSLFVLTNQNSVVKLDFAEMTIQHISFDKIVSDKKAFNPPKINRRYKAAKLPHKFDMPNSKDGRSLENVIASLYGLSVPETRERENFNVFIRYLVIDRNGKCVSFNGTVYDQRISKYYTSESVNQEMTEKLNNWVKEQTFETKLIPKGFDCYSFLCIVHLE